MGFPILQTKVTIPYPPASFLPRERLDALWDRWRDCRLVLVTAGAGFGKSSFLAAQARASALPVGWCTFDEFDTDFTSFGAHLLCAARQAAGENAIDSGCTPAESERELLADIVRILRGGEARKILVLDDVHLVSSSLDVIRFIDRLIRFLPEEVTLILSSREQLDLATMRLRSMGGVASLTSSDLAFTSDEIVALFCRRFPRSKLSVEVAERIARLTEGWAAGIEIFFQVLEGGAAELVDDALNQLKAAGSGWFPYFAEEVISKLDDEIRDFLYRSSVLPRLNAGLCDEVLRIDRSEAILEDLVSRNLFTLSTSDHGSFRYHHLFRDFLGVQLSRHFESAEVNRLRRRAAAALKKRHYWSEAAAAYSEAGDAHATVKLFERFGEELLTTGHYESLMQTLSSLPPALVNKSAQALSLMGRIHEIHGRWDEAEKTYRRAVRLTAPGPRRAKLMSYLAHHKTRKGDYRGSVALCKKALAEPGRLDSKIKGRILATRGVSSCDLGKLEEGEKFLEEAASIFRRRNDKHEEGRLLYILSANVYVHRGDFRVARDAARQALDTFRKLNNPRMVCHSLGVLGWVTAAGGDIVVGRELTLEALRQSESLGYRMMTAVCRFTLGFCDFADRDLGGASQNYSMAQGIGEELGEAEMRGSPHIGLSEVALAGGNLKVARWHAQRALDVFRGMNDKLLSAQSHMALALCYENTRPESVCAEFAKAEKLIRSAGAAFLLHKLLLLRLDTERMTEKVRKKCLRELIEGVARMDHHPLLLTLEPERSARVLSDAVRLGVECEFAGDILARLGNVSVPEIAPLATHDSEDVRLRSVEILAQIGGEMAHQVLVDVANETTESGRAAKEAADDLERLPVDSLEIRALGSLVIRRGDREIRLGDWKSKRALRLLQILLAHRFRWVPRDVLLEAMWPDADPRKARNNLRQTVFLLRKTLEPDFDESRAESYVRSRNEAYRLEAGEDRFFDVHQFEQLVGDATRLQNSGDKNEAAKLLLRATEVYRGDYMSESPYEESVVVEREQLRDQFLKCVLKLTTFYAEEGRPDDTIPLCRRGLQLDPYSEEFYWRLGNAHYEKGNRREVVAIFQKYEEMMIREMDLLPSPRMKNMAEKAALLGK